MKKALESLVLITILFGYKNVNSQAIESSKTIGGTLTESRAITSYQTKDSNIISIVTGNSVDFDFTRTGIETAFLISKIDKNGNPRFKYLIKDVSALNDAYLKSDKGESGYYEFIYTAYRPAAYSFMLFTLKIDTIGNFISKDSMSVMSKLVESDINNNIVTRDYLYNTFHPNYQNYFLNLVNDFDFFNDNRYSINSFYKTASSSTLYTGFKVNAGLDIFGCDISQAATKYISIAKKNTNGNLITKVVDSLYFSYNGNAWNYQNVQKLNDTSYIFSCIAEKLNGSAHHYKYYIFDTSLNYKVINSITAGFDSVLEVGIEEEFSNMKRITNGGKFIIYGRTLDKKPLIKCYGLNGNVLWSKTLNITGYFNNVPLIKDGKVFVSYFYKPAENQVTRGICIFDTLGNILMQYTSADTHNPLSYDVIAVFPNGNNFLLRYITREATGSKIYTVYNQISSTGNSLWTKEFVSDSIFIRDYEPPLYLSSDNSLLFNYNIKVRGSYDAIVCKFDATSGYTYWEKQIVGNGRDLGSMPFLLPNNKYFIDGTTGSTDLFYSENHSNANDYFYMIMKPSSNSIRGKVYIDVNNNNVYDAVSDILYTQGSISSAKGSTISGFYLNTNGLFNNLVDTGTYTSIFSGYNNYYTVLPASKVTAHSTYGNTDTVNYALHQKGNINDLQTTLVNTWVTRPGFTNSYKAVYINKGTTTISNAYVAVVLDNRLTYNNATPAPTAITGDTLKWSLSTLTPTQQGNILINFTGKTSPSLNANDSLISNARIYPIASDTTPTDNQYVLTDIARSSFDPNDKNIESNAILTPAQVTSGDYITYRIRFQNTGTFYATNVTIKDTLENNLDWNSLQVIATSHTDLETTVQNNILSFSFYNINLPPSFVNDAASHGYIVFKIKPKNTLVAGNTIKNSAHITFDFNTPVGTNTAVAKVITVTATINKYNTVAELNLFPNPNNGNFTVDFSSKGNFPITVTLFDITGKVVYQESLQHADRSFVQISDAVLPSGLYNIQISSDKDIWNKKVMVTK